jgi:V/A-type H+-transporting ATPase subunit K
VNDAREYLKVRITQSLIMLFTVMIIIFTVFSAKAFSQINEETRITDQNEPTEVSKDLQKVQAEEMKYALLAAAIAFGLGAIGAGLAISHVGAAAMGAVAEKPQVAGQALIFVALAEGIVVFGFITALMIIGKV